MTSSAVTLGVVPDAQWFETTVSCTAACPVGTDAGRYVVAISEGRDADAYDLARAHNPFPSICGRVCSAPCERACRRAVIDTPIAIRALKRVVAEQYGVEASGQSRWHRAHGIVPPATLPSVGIIGAGPAGLAAAYELRLAGHAVTVYERDARPGGMLVAGIPAFRLPRDVVADEIAAIIALGVMLELGCTVGRDVPVDTLWTRHAALLVTVGCSRGRALAIEGAELPGVARAVDVLRAVNVPTETSRAAGATGSAVDSATAPSGAVVVIGGGSVAFDAARIARRTAGIPEGVGSSGQTALDAARMARRTSTQPVILVAPEPRHELPVPHEELEEAEREGVTIRAGTAVRRIVGVTHVEQVVFAPVLRLRDADGRFNPQVADAAAGTDEIVSASVVILAVGQEADTTFLPDVSALARGPWGGLATSSEGRTAQPRLYAAGDVASGPRDLIDAVAFGQRVARAIHEDLAPDAVAISIAGHTAAWQPGAPDADPPHFVIQPPSHRYWSGYDRVSRTPLPVLSPEVRTFSGEVEAVLSPDDARREAGRCLRCMEHVLLDAGRCITCGGCVDVCPYGCISLVPLTASTGIDSAASFVLTLDEHSCIRCGLCVARCPTAALSIARAS